IFFFQAEDGIRAKLVTGVQTCALPIFGHIDTIGFVLFERARGSAFPCNSMHSAVPSRLPKSRRRTVPTVPCNDGGAARGCTQTRSEERRGGKERRNGVGADRSTGRATW